MQGQTTGLVLITALVMLLILSLLGMSGTQMMILQLRMVNNVQQMHQSFQAAEAALRDGEYHIAHHINQHTVFSPTCDQGLCASMALGAEPWVDQVDWRSGHNTLLYGSITGTSAFPGVVHQPRYIIERLPTMAATPDDSWYRVTAISYTIHGTIQHMLQSTYRQ